MGPPPPHSQLTRSSGNSSVAPELAELDALCRSLNQLDYFQLLNIETSASPADIKKAFYCESRRFHPGRFFQIPDLDLRGKVNDVYKRITEAYYVLRDDTKRRRYQADVSGPARSQKLRFNEASENETRQAAKKERDEEIGSHPKGRQFFQSAMRDVAAGKWTFAERNLKTALTYEPTNARYREKLGEVQQRLNEGLQATPGSTPGTFKIR